MECCVGCSTFSSASSLILFKLSTFNQGTGMGEPLSSAMSMETMESSCVANMKRACTYSEELQHPDPLPQKLMLGRHRLYCTRPHHGVHGMDSSWKEVSTFRTGMVQAWVAHFVTPLKRR
jgi:hypothetical protein